MSNGQWLVNDRFAPYVEAIEAQAAERPMDTCPRIRTPAEALTDPSPCDDCQRAARCSAQRLACSAFALFVHGMSPRRWALAPKTDACAARYAELFTQPKRRRGLAHCSTNK